MKMNHSIWLEGIKKKKYPELTNDLEVDVLIIGGGLTGISTAYHLRNTNLKVALVEKNQIGHGVTSRTTGKLTYLQENIYSKLVNYHGFEKAKLYLQSQKDAIELVKGIIKTHQIDCDFQKVDSYVFTTKNKEAITKEIRLLHQMQQPIFPIHQQVSGYYGENTYVFHPLKYLYALVDIVEKENVQIYESTPIIDIKQDITGYLCLTPTYSIKAKHVILCMHYPYFFYPFFFPLKTWIEKSYISVFKDENKAYSAISIDRPTISIRYYQDYCFYLSYNHDSSEDLNDGILFQKLKEQHSCDYLWSNKDIMTSDALPFIGAMNKKKTLWIATGYNTWGMTNGSLAGKILADLVLEKNNPYVELFDPLRKINKGKILKAVREI